MEHDHFKKKQAKRKQLTCTAFLLALFLLVCTASAMIAAPVSKAADSVADHSKTGSVPEYAIKERHEYSVVFTDTDMDYYKNNGLRIPLRTGFKPRDGKLYCASGKRYVVASREYLGDDYGIAGGSLSFNIKLDGGEFTLMLRDVNENLGRSDKALNILFKDGKVSVTDATNGTVVNDVAGGSFQNGRECQVLVSDRVSEIVVAIDGKEVLKAVHDTGDRYSVSNYKSRILFYNGGGTLLGTSESSILQKAGRFLLYAEKMEGCISDLRFDHTETDQTLPEGPARNVDYSNWVATDDLERTLPLSDTAGTPKENKQVGIFYFLCWVGAGIHVQDNTKLFLELGIDGMQKYLTEKGGEAYWAEPYFGYYRNTDAWVFRKHAYMLDAAGIDFIFLDVTNAEVFAEGHTILFDTWLKIRREGGHTPQICFICGDDPKTLDKDVAELRKTVYSKENYAKYEELFFKWNGKPLIFGNLDGAGKSTKKFLEDFEVRGCWAWCDKDGYWNWLEELLPAGDGTAYMYKGRDINGIYEQLAITLGHHSSASKGRSYVLQAQPTNGLNNFEFYLKSTPYGKGFASQADYALSESPPCVMITGWNEWIAGNGRNLDFMANTPVKNVNYVDEFNPEFSRDGEPMKIRDGVGFGDNYYYQIIDFVRRYKGIGELKTATGQDAADGDVSESIWERVGPEYKDTIGDAEFRNTVCYDADFRYLNGTGRNDLDTAKVTQDGKYFYFTVTAVHDVVKADDPSWMNLYVDVDMDHKTGWEGYDFVINRTRSGEEAYVEALVGGDFSASVVKGTAEIITDGKRFTLKVPKQALGLKEYEGANFDFKWADNSTETGDVMEFMDLGDTAPNDRFNFRFISDSFKYERMTDGSGKEKAKTIDPRPFIFGGAGLLAVAVISVLTVLAVRRKRSGGKRDGDRTESGEN
ncbi:MAG: hypothetical protein IKX06_05345 [Clostridia bacterium]|nr:hypothetical protein [Clostridia bacterium]